MLDLVIFKQSLKKDRPPKAVSGALEALWWDGKDNWDKAHKIAQDIPDHEGAWVHAYLHRKEGDEGNAGYWYSRAGKPKSTFPLEKEWEELVQAFLGKMS